MLSPLFAEAETLRLQYGLNELESKSTPKWLTYLNMVSCWAPSLVPAAADEAAAD